MMAPLPDRFSTSPEHRLCRRHAESPEVPPSQPETGEKLKKLRELMEHREGMEGDASIGASLTCEGKGAQALGRETVERKHLPLLRSFRGTKLLIQDEGNRRTIRVEKDSNLLGTIETGSSNSALWKGDLLRILQTNARGLLVDHLRVQDYERAMALESQEFSDSVLSHLEGFASHTQKQKEVITEEIRRALGITKDISAIALPQTPEEGALPTTQVLVTEKDHPSRPLTVFEVGKQYSAGPESHISRVRAMNDHPSLEEIPSASMIAFIRNLTGLQAPLIAPRVELERKGKETILRLFSSRDGRTAEPMIAAEVALDRSTGAVLRKSARTPE